MLQNAECLFSARHILTILATRRLLLGAPFQDQAFPKLLFIMKILQSMVAVKVGGKEEIVCSPLKDPEHSEIKCFCFVLT